MTSGDGMRHLVLLGSMLRDLGIKLLHVVDCKIYRTTPAVLLAVHSPLLA